MTDTTLKTLLLAEDRSAGKTFRAVGDEADAAGDRFDGMGDKGVAAFKAIGIGGGLALGAGLAGALSAEAANDKLAAQLGVGAQKAGELGEVAGDLYTGAFGDSMEQVNEAIKLVVQNIDGMADASKAELEAISGQVLAVSDTFDQDLGGITRAVSQLMRNDLAPNAEAALDIVTKGLQNGTNKADDLLDTFNEYGTMFRDIGLDGKESLGLMSQGLKAGARDADTVADALKEFAIRAQDGSDTSAAGFKAVGLNAAKMTAAVAKGGPGAKKALDAVLDGLQKIENPAKRNAAAVALFGTKAEDLGDSLFALDLDTATAGLEDLEGAAQDVSDTVADNASTAITEFKRSMEQAFINVLGGKVIPFVEEHKTGLIALGIAVGTVMALNKAHTAVMALQAAGGLKAVITGTKTFTAMQWLLNAALTANPIGLVIAALVALGVGLVMLYKKSETFRNIVDGAFRAVADGASFMWDEVIRPILKAWVNMWLTVVGTLVSGAAKAFGWVPGIGGKLKTAAAEFEKFKTKVNDSLSGIQDEQVNVKIVMTAEQKVNAGQPLTAQDMNSLLGVRSNAIGTDFFAGGLTRIDERGSEIIDLPRGSRIYPASETDRMMSAENGGDLGTLTIVVVSETGDVIEQKLARVKRTRGGLKLAFET